MKDLLRKRRSRAKDPDWAKQVRHLAAESKPDLAALGALALGATGLLASRSAVKVYATKESALIFLAVRP